MRWLVGWAADNARGSGTAPRPGREIRPVGAQQLWDGPDPLWAVGDWRPDEVRVVEVDGGNRLAVLGCCGASDEQLRVGLFAARGGALRHLTAWPGSYTAVVRIGRRVTVTTDLAGARPVFHTPWAGGTAYATAALPLADLIEAQLDVGHLAALLACPDVPEALGDGTPYAGVRRVPPGHALILRDGSSRETVSYEPAVPTVVAAAPVDADDAVAGIRDALVEAVRVRLAAPRHAPVPDLDDLDPGPVPGMGPAQRRAGRPPRGPAPGIGADLSGGSASATLALLAAGLPGMPGTVYGTAGTAAGERLLAVTFNDLTLGPLGPLDASGAQGLPSGRAVELERARSIAENPRLHHVVVALGEEALPYAGPDGGPLVDGPLTDEPGPSLITAERHRRRLAAGSADQLGGYGARQVLDGHPARLADLLLDRRRRHLLRPVTALARAEGPPGRSVLVPLTVYRAARRLARTPYRDGMLDAARRLREHEPAVVGAGGAGPDGAAVGAGGGAGNGAGAYGALDASLAALTWCRPGPAARWLTGEVLAEVSIRLEQAALRPVPDETGTRPGERRARAALARLAADHRLLEQAAEVRSQRLHAPFLDNQVVRACRALPEALRVQPGARASVLRAVLTGAGIRELPPGWGVPSQVTDTAAARTGLRSRIGELIDLFDAPLLADAGLVEARVVRRALRAAAEGEPLPLDGLAELVSTEVWLRRLLARRGSCWTGTAAPRQRAVAGGVPQRPSL
ncbi:asparagine synthase-related protein [Streptomyces sp. TRM 70361]|uniref:asparagine synthase-related protein n=1 Tax=Streptomyces sp. TRM 70361 TaxID=3116553 RepID=UPI002E7AE4E4|nr:asparagine synthase-related protein [Streptomyces sp. TRM 70361]MEE1941638.1 asparagine synthase-related protein [Streptomyces sp. TRM 70361]